MHGKAHPPGSDPSGDIPFMQSRGPHPLGHGPWPVRNWAMQKVLRPESKQSFIYIYTCSPSLTSPWSVKKWSSKKLFPAGKKKLGNTDTEIKGCRTENNICLVGDLQEHGHLTYKGSRKSKGFLYEEVCNNHHTTNPFTTQETWTLTWGRWFYGTPAHHLLGLPASQIKSLFLAPTTHHSFYWPFECSDSYSIAFIVMQRAVQAWTW